MTTTAKQIRGAGAPITLTDGRTMNLRYGMAALLTLEDKFETTSGIDAALRDATSGKGRSMTTIAEFLLAGLGHEGSREELLDLLDLSQLEAYGEAIGAAFAESFGEAAEDAGAPGKDGAPRAPQPSRGEPGTTQQPSPSDEAMNSSGA